MNSLVMISLILLAGSSASGAISNRISSAILIAGSVLFGFALFNPSQIESYFSLIASVVWILVGFYSISYGQKYGRWLPSMLSLTVFGMALILSSKDLIMVLVGWEVMSIPSYVIIGLYRKASQAPFAFMAFSEASLISLVIGLIILFNSTGSVAFPLRIYNPLVLLFISLGAMIKMGITPYSINEWLPVAHGSAPANASAVFSSTMTLMGVYLIFRFVSATPFAALFQPVGFLILTSGVFAALFTALYSYTAENKKRLAGFSTVDNQGAILAAFGLAIMTPDETIRRFAMITVLIFTLAHALGKTGLFFSVGSSSGENIYGSQQKTDRIGKIGSAIVAISLSGLFPTIGGLAAWSLLESFFMQAYYGGYIGVIAIISGSVIAMAEGLVSGAIAKILIFTRIFKAKKYAKNSYESIVLLVTASLLVLAFLLSYAIYGANYTGGVPTTLIFPPFDITSKFSSGSIFGLVSPFFISLIILFSFTAWWGLLRPRGVRYVEPWNTGSEQHDDFTSFGFSSNIRIMLGRILRTRDSGKESLSISNPFWTAMILVGKYYRKATEKISYGIMNSSIGWYMIYMIVAFLAIILVVSFL